jgi:hypothetical protein
MKARLSNVTPIKADPWHTADGEPIVKVHLAVEQNDDPPFCNHGSMKLKQGNSLKTGKDYYGWTCDSGNIDDQCPAQWWQLSPDGVWKPKVAK